MNVLIILAHPERRSFNAKLAETTQQIWAEKGHDVNLIDLYHEDFDPREASWHYNQRQNTDRFDVMQEQRHSWDVKSLPEEINRHIGLLLNADIVVFHFPFWWCGVPAILKGWMDRVFVYGGLYRSGKRYENGILQGKNALLVSTGAASARLCLPDGREGDTRLMLWPFMYSLHYVGFNVLEPYLIHGVRGGLAGKEADVLKNDLEEKVKNYIVKLGKWNEWPLVPFNRNSDFTNEGILKPDAPVYSPFIRHVDLK